MCFSKRTTPACIVATLSIILSVLAITLMVLSVQFTGTDIFTALKTGGGINRLKTIFFYIMGTLSVLALFLGIWGLTLLKCRIGCCPIVFGVCLLPTWIITFVFGAVIAWFSHTSPTTIQSFC